MMVVIFFIIVVSGLTNMIADVLLQSGRLYSDGQQSDMDVVLATKESHLFISAVLGAVSISCWQAPLFLLMKVGGTIGTLLQLSFLFMISCITVFHVVCCMGFHLYKANQEKEKAATQYLQVFGPLTFIPGLVYTVAMIYAGLTGTLHLEWFHYATLPILSIIVIRFIMGKMLKRVPYFAPVSGTLSMIVSLLSLLHIMAINF